VGGADHNVQHSGSIIPLNDDFNGYFIRLLINSMKGVLKIKSCLKGDFSK